MGLRKTHILRYMSDHCPSPPPNVSAFLFSSSIACLFKILAPPFPVEEWLPRGYWRIRNNLISVSWQVLCTEKPLVRQQIHLAVDLHQISFTNEKVLLPTLQNPARLIRPLAPSPTHRKPSTIRKIYCSISCIVAAVRSLMLWIIMWGGWAFD